MHHRMLDKHENYLFNRARLEIDHETKWLLVRAWLTALEYQRMLRKPGREVLTKRVRLTLSSLDYLRRVDDAS